MQNVFMKIFKRSQTEAALSISPVLTNKTADEQDIDFEKTST